MWYVVLVADWWLTGGWRVCVSVARIFDEIKIFAERNNR